MHKFLRLSFACQGLSQDCFGPRISPDSVATKKQTISANGPSVGTECGSAAIGKIENISSEIPYLIVLIGPQARLEPA